MSNYQRPSHELKPSFRIIKKDKERSRKELDYKIYDKDFNEFDDPQHRINRIVNRPNLSSEAKPSWQRHYSSGGTPENYRNRAFQRETFENLSSPEHPQRNSGTPVNHRKLEDSTHEGNSYQSSDSKISIKSYRRRSSSKTKRKGFKRQGDSPSAANAPPIIPSFECSAKPQFATNTSYIIEAQKKIIRERKKSRISYLEKIRSFN